MTRTERNLLEEEFRRRLGKLMPNDLLWLDEHVESLRRLITGQTVYQARDTVVEYVETVKCHLMGEPFTGWVGHTDPEIAEPMARPTLLCRNIKKYEEHLELNWLRNGRRHPASMTMPEIWDEFRKDLLREVRHPTDQRRSLWSAMSGIGCGNGRVRSHLTELPSLATRLKQSNEADKSTAYLDRVFGKPRGAI